MNDKISEITLLDCPLCNGPSLLEEENGWCFYATCLDCGCHTAEVPFQSENDRETAAKKAAELWNMGKVVSFGVSE